MIIIINEQRFKAKRYITSASEVERIVKETKRQREIDKRAKVEALKDKTTSAYKNSQGAK